MTGKNRSGNQMPLITETLQGIVERVTYHNTENGWSVLRVSPFGASREPETVIVHQTRVFAGATMEFKGAWTHHPRYGRQFKALEAIEKKPATAAALEKYLGSGLIKGVGPKTARKIVRHFGARTLDIFEGEMARLLEVPGIAKKKLAMIRRAWEDHRAIREVMMFLQSHGISTLFAVRIYKEYGDDAIAIVAGDPYRLARDFYGIGFFSADRIALSIGLAPDSTERIMAGIRHVLSASREFGHCYLTGTQILAQVEALFELDLKARLPALLQRMEGEGLLMTREVPLSGGVCEKGYYAKSLYYDEAYVAHRIRRGGEPVAIDLPRVDDWLARFCRATAISLSEEQAWAVKGIAGQRFAILTGGPGCGKTTTTRVLVRLLEAMGQKVMLAAPTGRAAQRMTDVIDREARTLHRLLEWQGGEFKKNEDAPLDVDFLVVDESSMLDIHLAAALLRAVPEGGRVLFIGDADQLPSVGAGNVLRDMIASGRIPCYRLTHIFRQAGESLIVRYAHQINSGQVPRVDSPFHRPDLWQDGADCLFIDAEEATREQLGFISRVKKALAGESLPGEGAEDPYAFRAGEAGSPFAAELPIPPRFLHVDLDRLLQAKDRADELKAVLKKVHPWSALHYGITAAEAVKKLYVEWIPRYRGEGCEIQVLSPMTRGTLGTVSLNQMIQAAANPPGQGKREVQVGARLFREGDRVIHRRNNYDLGVFNGDIGTIALIDHQELSCRVRFFPDGREVLYQREDMMELDLAYAITIHKSQGSEFEAVIVPVVTQHFKMLFRNLIYTGLTRARKLAVFVGTRKALALAVKNQDTALRQTALAELLQGGPA